MNPVVTVGKFSFLKFFIRNKFEKIIECCAWNDYIDNFQESIRVNNVSHNHIILFLTKLIKKNYNLQLKKIVKKMKFNNNLKFQKTYLKNEN